LDIRITDANLARCAAHYNFGALSSMNIDLFSESMLGHWDVSPSISQCEYQFGQRLVYVQHPKGKSQAAYIANAQETITAAWNDIGNAVRFAEKFSRRLIPAFWKSHDESEKPGARFDVYSIHYNLGNPHPVYTIGINHDFDFHYLAYAEADLWKESPTRIELPEPPDGFLISLKRLGQDHFEGAN